MEKIKVDVQWCDKNFGAKLSDNVPGAVVLTAKSYEELLREVPETLRFHVEGMVQDGDDVPQWLRDGDYEFVYNLLDVATLLRASEPYVSLAALSRASGINHCLTATLCYSVPRALMLWAFHVVWYAMTADMVRGDVLGSDTRRQLPQVKSPYIFRSDKKGNCLGSVGRWGLLKQTLRSFSALKPLKWAFYRGFRAGDSGIFVKNDPNCHSRRWQFGAQSGKTGSVAVRPWAIASRFE